MATPANTKKPKKDSKFKAGMAKPANSGKKKGSKNKKTQQWEVFAEYMVNGGLKQFQKDMKKITEWQRIRAIEAMMDFFKPRLSRVEYKDEAPEQGITLAEYAKQMAEIKKLVDENYKRNKAEGLC